MNNHERPKFIYHPPPEDLEERFERILDAAQAEEDLLISGFIDLALEKSAELNGRFLPEIKNTKLVPNPTGFYLSKEFSASIGLLWGDKLLGMIDNQEQYSVSALFIGASKDGSISVQGNVGAITRLEENQWKDSELRRAAFDKAVEYPIRLSYVKLPKSVKRR